MGLWQWFWEWLTGRHVAPDRSQPAAATGFSRGPLHSEGKSKSRHPDDILYLGRGVSQGLADRRADAQRLRQLGLPVLATPGDVAAALGVTVSHLRWLTYHSEAAVVDHYLRFTVPKKNGGLRELAAPHRDLRRCQQWIREHLLARLPAHPAAHGFLPGRNIVTNARPHARAAILVNVDLADFFPSITFPRVQGLWKSLGFSPAAATILALLCTDAPRRKLVIQDRTCYVATGPRVLPQGACTSPAVSNLIARRLDARLSGIAARLGWTYTRYADDLTFSYPAAADTVSNPSAADRVGNAPPALHDPKDRAAHNGQMGYNGQVGYLLARIRHIVQDEGFRVNEEKTRVLRRNAAQIVTGLVVNDGVHVKREIRRRLRAILHQAERTGLAAQNRGGHPNFVGQLLGQVAFVAMVQPREGARLKERLLRLLAEHP
jgi:retron-type reverse transcriptase